MASAFLWSDIWAGGLIGFREAVEAALIIGVLLTWLARSERGDLANWIWKGVGAGVLASLVVAALFAWVWGGVESFKEHGDFRNYCCGSVDSGDYSLHSPSLGSGT